MSRYFYNDDLRKFESLNKTCKSIYELGEVKVLIILKDGTNLTDYLDIENPEDVIYISEDLSERVDLERYYYLGQVFEKVYGGNSSVFLRYTENPFRNIRAMVVQGVSGKVTSLNGMFRGIENLKTVSGLDTWDMSGIKTFDSLFIECRNLKTVHGWNTWDVSNVYDMTCAFDECISLEDISDLKNWDVSNVKSVRGMFKYCNSLKDISSIESWNLNSDCDTKNMFLDTKFENSFESENEESKIEENLKKSNVKPGIVCEKCGSSRLVLSNGMMICSDCNSPVKSHIELKCPDCEGADFEFTGFEIVCKRCGRIILEDVNFDSEADLR